MCFKRVFIGYPTVNLGAEKRKFGQSPTSHRVRDSRVFRDASGRVQGFLMVFDGFGRFSSFFCTFHQEFPCCRVRSLAVFVTFGQHLSCDSHVEGSVRWPFWSFLGNFCHVIPLLKGPSIAHFDNFFTGFVLKFPCSRLRSLALRALPVEFASVASELCPRWNSRA